MGKKAFLVGINDYAPIGHSIYDLNGCINDVRDMANTLVICGFPPESIRLCTDNFATKEGIMAGLEWLLENTSKDDSLVFYYSGHGSQISDINGDEIDYKDEIICPHDIDFTKKVYISDDDIRDLLSKYASNNLNLEIIFDSCHSGTGTRESIALQQMSETCKIRFRYLKPPVDLTFHIEYNPDLLTKKLFSAKNGKRDISIVSGLNHVFWAACRDNQTSQETNIDGDIRGVFTYHFCQVLRKTNGNIKRRELYNIVTAAIKRAGFSQIPQLETSSNTLADKLFLTFSS